MITAYVIETSEWYVESKDRGRAIVAEVLNETRHWRRAAQTLGSPGPTLS